MNWHWGRKKKKKTSASSMTGRGMSSVTKMFPISWISKLRQGNGNENERRINGRKAKDAKRNTWLQEEEDKSHRVEKFYKETDENFWRLSFSDECVQEKKSVDSSPSESTCRDCGAKGVSKDVKESQSMDFNDMLLDMRKLKNLELDLLSHGFNRDAKTANLKGNPTIQHLDVKDIAEVEAVKPTQTTSVRTSHGSPSSLSSQHQHNEASLHSRLRGSECKNLGEVGEERKSIYIDKGSLKRRSKSGRSSKVKVYSPRTPSKIRALEDLKKSRMKMRVKEKQLVVESLAVVKRSVDPQRDFRNSMLEMILDKGINQAEELEELLACYLILNSDEYHDMIIKVFRQVWFDLNKDRLDPPLKDAEICNN